MANLKEIRNRIASVTSTRKITSAMSRIAAARLHKAQAAMTRARAYGERVQTVVKEVLGDVEDREAYELLADRKVERIAAIVVTADRGLCGGFNSNLTRDAIRGLAALRKEGKDVTVIAVGRKSLPLLRGAGFEVVNTLVAPTPDTAVDVAKDVSTEAIFGFTKKSEEGTRFDRVILIYNHFKNVLTQEATTVQLLPVVPAEVDSGSQQVQRLIEPDAAQVLATLLPLSVETALQQAMFHSAAAEIAARRSAMDSATENASSLIDELTLEYNRERQAAITTELMEIIGGSEAQKG